MPPTKEDFQHLPHLGTLNQSYRNPKAQMSLTKAKNVLQKYVGLKEKPLAANRRAAYHKPVFKNLVRVIFNSAAKKPMRHASAFLFNHVRIHFLMSSLISGLLICSSAPTTSPRWRRSSVIRDEKIIIGTSELCGLSLRDASSNDARPFSAFQCH